MVSMDINYGHNWGALGEDVILWPSVTSLSSCHFWVGFEMGSTCWASLVSPFTQKNNIITISCSLLFSKEDVVKDRVPSLSEIQNPSRGIFRYPGAHLSLN
jgi:hypothetical protein